MMKFPHEEGKSGMSLKKYEAFVRTVELGSLTKAAEAMGSTQSRISHVLSALEEEYGFFLLLNRINRNRARKPSHFHSYRTGSASYIIHH